MAKTRRRVLSILMALVLVLGLLPTSALATPGGTNYDYPVRFYVLKPELGTPGNNGIQDKGSYYPNESSNGGVPGATWLTGYTGGFLTQEGYQLAVRYGASGYFNPDGIPEGIYKAPPKANLGDFADEEIVWYSLKRVTDASGKYYCNIDGYVKNTDVNIVYYANFTGATPQF